MKTITISRKKWLRGDIDDLSVNHLWNSEKQAGCCLGHVIHQTQRLPWYKLQGIGEPQSVEKPCLLLTNKCSIGDDVYFANNAFTEQAMEINDDGGITNKQRESRLIKLFKKNKLKLIFKD